MPHDRDGKPLQIGNEVDVPCRVEAISKDGTRVSLSVIRPKDSKETEMPYFALDGKAVVGGALTPKET